jgi:serine protease inhibitor
MKRIAFIVIALVLLLAACSPGAPGGTDEAAPAAHRAALKAQPIQPVNRDFVMGVNSFGLKSAGLLYAADGNLAVSPVSLELALAMARTGAAGTTADEMANALGLSGMSDEDIVGACRSLMWRANTGGMEAANSIWLNKDDTFSDTFVRGCTEDFMADAFPLEIPGAMDAINAWAGDKTHGRIDDIIQQELSTDVRLVLCNALYFLGDWETPFEANDTYDEEFAAPGGPVKASFMHSDRSAAYYKNDAFSLVSLPFKSGEDEGKYAMAFLLPEEGSGVDQMLASLDAASFSKALSDAVEQQVRVKLPKFEYSFFSSFKDTLKALGMNAAFGNANFSRMTGSPDGLYIEDVLHKCFVKVDELGAEAAAVTAVVMARGAALPPENAAEFYADRPFAFAIYSQEDGAIAFLGVVNDPTQK